MNGLKTVFDHLVVAAESLVQGVAWAKAALGIEIPLGGEHPRMGTHNRLMRLGDDCFFEIIAVNPAAEPPERPRWFGLDDPYVKAALADSPRLITWVVNTPDIDRLTAETGFPFGEISPMKRGNLTWRITVPPDGSLLASGAVPYAIQWDAELHPAGRMPDLGCSLQRLEIHHPRPGWLTGVLAEIGADRYVDVVALPGNSAPCLVAVIDTPSGFKRISGGEVTDG